MAKYIDADKLKAAWVERVYIPPRCGKTLNSLLASVMAFIDDLPAADVVEVKHGYWKLLTFKGGRRSGQAEAKCSICGRDAVYQIVNNRYEFENFCPHCGVKMRGESNEREA